MNQGWSPELHVYQRLYHPKLRRCEKIQKLTDWIGGCRRNCRAVTSFSLNDKNAKQSKIDHLKRPITLTFSTSAFYSFGDIPLSGLLFLIFSQLLRDYHNYSKSSGCSKFIEITINFVIIPFPFISCNNSCNGWEVSLLSNLVLLRPLSKPQGSPSWSHRGCWRSPSSAYCEW